MIVQENLNEKVSQPRLCQGTNEFRGISWDELENRFIYSTFQIFLKKQEIYYIKEGQIIRLDTIKDETKEPDYLTNLDQIKFLNWIGSCDKKNQKIGKWITIWKGGVLQGIGGYYAEGEKQGLWKEISKNFQNQAQIYEYGEYMNDKRQGIWKHLYKQTEIGGGRYNPLGQRHGKWIQASDSFWDQSNITYIGVYENGIKIGLWDIQFNEKGIDYLVGGGFYDQGVKVGHWVDIFDGFWFHSCITYHGEYNKGKKIGNWNSFWDARSKIGGGSYDEGIKIGNWIEVSDGIFDQSIVTFMGEYNKGQKIGRWETLFSDKGNIQWIGGGEYDEKGQGLKIGSWINVSDGFYAFSQVILNGQYKYGKKIGRWNILYNNTYIGGGLYDEEGRENKIGNWIEINDDFSDWSQVNFKGMYKNGVKVGQWDIWSKDANTELIQIGGGTYDEESKGLKVGNWTEITDGFKHITQVTYNGVYKNGIKVGKWEIWGRKDFEHQKIEMIGGGDYDENGLGVKKGKWIEICDGFIYSENIAYIGIYENGKKIGIWVEVDVDTQEELNKINYDQ